MTDTRHTQPRCPICRWPYRPGGCTPAQCQNPEPEDVDAELAPKGLQVLTLTEPIWLGPWHPSGRTGRTRNLLKISHNSPRPWVHDVRVRCETDGLWTFEAGIVADESVWGEGHPTPEAAQAACEAAIVAAWRNR